MLPVLTPCPSRVVRRRDRLYCLVTRLFSVRLLPVALVVAPRLTGRETEVLRLVAKGLSYKQIAERFVVSHRTVQNTLGKLQLHNRVELTRYAIEQGLERDTLPFRAGN